MIPGMNICHNDVDTLFTSKLCICAYVFEYKPYTIYQLVIVPGGKDGVIVLRTHLYRPHIDECHIRHAVSHVLCTHCARMIDVREHNYIHHITCGD